MQHIVHYIFLILLYFKNYLWKIKKRFKKLSTVKVVKFNILSCTLIGTSTFFYFKFWANQRIYWFYNNMYLFLFSRNNFFSRRCSITCKCQGYYKLKKGIFFWFKNIYIISFKIIYMYYRYYNYVNLLIKFQF